MCGHECYLFKFFVLSMQLIGHGCNVKFEMASRTMGNCPCSFQYYSFSKKQKNIKHDRLHNSSKPICKVLKSKVMNEGIEPLNLTILTSNYVLHTSQHKHKTLAKLGQVTKLKFNHSSLCTSMFLSTSSL